MSLNDTKTSYFVKWTLKVQFHHYLLTNSSLAVTLVKVALVNWGIIVFSLLQTMVVLSFHTTKFTNIKFRLCISSFIKLLPSTTLTTTTSTNFATTTNKLFIMFHESRKPDNVIIWSLGLIILVGLFLTWNHMQFTMAVFSKRTITRISQFEFQIDLNQSLNNWNQTEHYWITT